MSTLVFWRQNLSHELQPDLACGPRWLNLPRSQYLNTIYMLNTTFFMGPIDGAWLEFLVLKAKVALVWYY